MRLFENTYAKIIIWLAAVLLPAETMPLMACTCGSHSQRAVQAGAGSTAGAPVAACSRCTSGSRPQNACCGAKTKVSEHPEGCCGAKTPTAPTTCRCQGAAGSHGSVCQCSAKSTAPAPAPMPGNSRPDSTKSSMGASTCCGLTAVVAIVPSASQLSADQSPAILTARQLDRLSVLCRLMI
jgi:hypothetical protein